MPTPRQLVLPAAAAGLLALVALAALVGTGAVSVTVAVLFGMIVLLLGLQVLVVAGIRRADGKVLRLDARVKRCEAGITQVAAAAERLDTRLGEIAELLNQDRLRRDEDLNAVLASLGEERLHAMSLRQEMRELAEGLMPRLAAVEARTSSETGT
ncbi:hypothetical protein [Planobispora takensis]|uniref:Uncharacterized protein n=1 Tax=Planobispora takensis TaxID=1367882 RepID=A0A8J3WUA2_9ACTN|nr:hypothetical protein [Planobispora takensis]GII01298.1 hypothetical protein Pta02_33060 [Planobispora takensis]